MSGEDEDADPDAGFAGEPFSRASGLVGRIYDRALSSTGLSGAGFTCLTSLVAVDGASPAQLSYLMGVDQESALQAVEALERQGLVETRRALRRPAAHHVTPSGREIHARAAALWREAQDKVIAAIGDHETHALLDALVDAEERLQKRRKT